MLRGILAVAVGFLVWSILWVGSNAVIVGAFPQAVGEDGSFSGIGFMILCLVDSVAFSIFSGWLTAFVAGRRETRYAAILGVVLLAVGVFVQVQYWHTAPVAYHLSFLVLLFPMAWFGGRLRAGRQTP